MRVSAAAVLSSFLFASVALAQDPKVTITAEVVSVSKQGSTIEPSSLASMRDQFKKQPETSVYTSFKRTSSQKLELQKGKPLQVKIAPNMDATVRLVDLKEDTANVSVEVPKLLTTTLTLGKKGAVYVRVNKDTDPVLVLVLTPGA